MYAAPYHVKPVTTLDGEIVYYAILDGQDREIDAADYFHEAQTECARLNEEHNE